MNSRTRPYVALYRTVLKNICIRLFFALGIENIVSFSQDNTALLTKENGTQAMEKSLENKNDNVKDPPKNRFRFPKPGFLKKSKAQRNPVADDSTAYFGGLPFPDIAGTYRSLI